MIAQAKRQRTKVLTRPKASAMRTKINEYVRDHAYTIEELYGPATHVFSSMPKSKRGAIPESLAAAR